MLHVFPRVENSEGWNLVIRTGLCVTMRVGTLTTKDRVVRHNKGAYNYDKRERGRYGAILCARV